MPFVYLETFGCQMNVADSDMLAELLAQQGYATTDSVEKADLIIVNTCSVREHAEQRARARIAEYGALKRKRGNNQALWVIGCMAQRLGDTIKKEIPAVDRVIGAVEVETIRGHISEYLASVDTGVSGEHSRGASSFVPIMRGCNNYCSYCIVPYVRGREHSVPVGQLEDTVGKLVDRDVKEITLLGQNVDSYRDTETELDFAGLLRRLHAIEGIRRIRFTTSHPKDCSENLIRTVGELPSLCNHIHLPVQSGSTRILSLMNREYTREDYLRLIEMIRRSIPGVDITTDVMVGFPGETQQDFDDTLSLVENIRFTSAFMFAFSPRPGTKAAQMKDPVPKEIGKQRLAQLIDLQTQITKEHYRAMAGHVVEVLITERQTKRDGLWMGRDYGCKRVLLSCDDNVAGTILDARVMDTSGMTLLCERTQ